MVATSYMDALEIKLREELAALQQQFVNQQQAGETILRGEDAFIHDGSEPARTRLTALHDLLDLFERSDDARQVLGELIGQHILATEGRLVQRMEQQTHDAAVREQQLEGKQRRDNIFISSLSLIVGWLLSLLGTPAALLVHFVH